MADPSLLTAARGEMLRLLCRFEDPRFVEVDVNANHSIDGHQPYLYDILKYNCTDLLNNNLFRVEEEKPLVRLTGGVYPVSAAVKRVVSLDVDSTTLTLYALLVVVTMWSCARVCCSSKDR
jgi:hypothetical protein